MRSLLQWQPGLFDALADEPSFDGSFCAARRVDLDSEAWVERVAGWVTGAAALFATIVEVAPWEQRRMHMYDRMVDEPRLIAWYGTASQRCWEHSVPKVARAGPRLSLQFRHSA